MGEAILTSRSLYELPWDKITGKPEKKLFEASANQPSDQTILWIDTTPKTGGLKYYDSVTSSWKHSPVAYT